MRRFLAVAGLMILSAAPACPLDRDYHPYAPEELKAAEATALQSSATSAVECGIRLIEDAGGGQECEFVISVDGKAAFSERYDYWLRKSCPPLAADLDGNGLADVVLPYYPGTQGLGLGCRLYLYSQIEPGVFAKLWLPAERFSPEDICDLNGDGRREIITCVLIRHEGHSYWVYRAWRLDGPELANVDASLGFPRGAQFTHKPNRRPVEPALLDIIMDKHPETGSMAETGKP